MTRRLRTALCVALAVLSGALDLATAQSLPGATASMPSASEPSPPPASALLAASGTSDDAMAFVAYGQDFAALCVGRQGVEINVHNTHPSRTVRAWFDRYHMGTGTGDRSHTDLAPHAEPEPLGCSKTDYGSQEWRLVRARFID